MANRKRKISMRSALALKPRKKMASGGYADAELNDGYYPEDYGITPDEYGPGSEYQENMGGDDADSYDGGGYGAIPDELLDEDDRMVGMGAANSGGAYPRGPGYVNAQNAAQMAPFSALQQKQQDSLQLLRDAQRRAVESLKPTHDKSAMWLSIAQGLLSPTRTGAFSESLGNAAGGAAPYVQREEDAEQAYKSQLSGMDYDLAQALYKDANKAPQIIDWYARNPDGSVGKQKAMIVDGQPVPFGEIFSPGGAGRPNAFQAKMDWLKNASKEELARYKEYAMPKGDSTTVINSGQPYERQDQKNAADMKKGMSEEAYKSLGLANQLNAVLPEIEKTPDAYFGPGGPGMVWAGKAFKQLGFDVGDGLDSAAFVSSIMSHLGPAQRIVGSGSSSDKDVALFMNSLPGLTQTKAGNIALVKYYNKMAQYNRKLVKIMNAAADRGDYYGMDDQASAEIEKLGRVFSDQEAAELQSLGQGKSGVTPKKVAPKGGVPHVNVQEDDEGLTIDLGDQ